MPISTVIIISLLLANLSLTLFMFWIVHDLLSAVKSLQDTEEISLKAFDMCTNQMNNNNDILKTTGEKYDHMMRAYDYMMRAYEIMRKQYDSIVSMDTKLLECWKGCEERYSQSYELFKHCSDNLKEVSHQLTELANISTEDEYTLTLNEACDTVCLDCPYDQCLKEDCPVYTIKHNNQPDIKFNEIPYDSSILIHDFSNATERSAEILNRKTIEGSDNDEWTDDNYLEAVNTHPEEDD